MKLRNIAAVAASAMLLGSAFSSPAFAGESAAAWGTLGYNGGSARALASAQLHQVEGTNAQQETIGKSVTTMYRSISSCGYCVYNQITGDQNSINGNTISGTNSGTVTATGTFGGN